MKWDPTTGKVVRPYQGMDSCFALSAVAQFEGIWEQGFESSTFTDGSWLHIDGRQQERIFRMVGAPINQEPLRIHLKFDGRKALGSGGYGHLGAFKSLIVVTGVDAASLVEPPLEVVIPEAEIPKVRGRSKAVISSAPRSRPWRPVDPGADTGKDR